MRILLAEDDKMLNHTLKYQLEKQGFTVDTCFDGDEALYFIREGIHDIILLDRMLPYMDGIHILKTIRNENITTPVIFITALGELQDKVTGLNLGADDYLVKPFAFEELLARIHCITRRPAKVIRQDALSFGDICYLPEDKVLMQSSIPDASLFNSPLSDSFLSDSSHESGLSLSGREGNLMEALLRGQGQTISREILLSKVWGIDHEVENGNLDNYIHFLRRRLRTLKSHVQIETIRGIGYRLTFN